MKRLFFILAVTLCMSSFLFAEESDEEYDYNELVNTIKSVKAPYLQGDYVIFTAERDVRHIGIAFDFEDFTEIHSFKLKKFTNMEYEESDSLLFYILKLPKNVLEVNYRLIVDGLWTTDPLNENLVFNKDTNLMMSHIDCTREIPPVTEKIANGKVRFVYKGKSGQKIRLGGSFTNWDSWIYQMKETKPGIYEFELPLAPGEYQYAYFTGINSFPDNTNKVKCYTSDGKVASLLIVN